MRDEKEILKKLKEVEEVLCRLLDETVYLPVAKELSSFQGTHTLGIRKEKFKGHLSEKIDELIRWILGEEVRRDVGTARF